MDISAILERRLISALKGGLAHLQALTLEWKNLAHPPEAEWSKMRSLEFQDALKIQQALERKLDTFECVLDPEFEEKVRRSL